MELTKQPFVSIVTPVYNGEKYLAECIESVLEQTYSNWEYIILDNCSTDDSLEIAKHYAGKDGRIKVLTNDTFLEQIPNWNESMRKISDDSKYCKVVHADDCILPECLEKMVAKAEEYPTVGIVSSYRFVNTRIPGLYGKGLSYKTTFMEGKEAAKMVLMKRNYLFGTPSTLLYRADLVRKRDQFYDPYVFHADTENCFELLKESDFAFVHQLLSFTRRHEQAANTFSTYFHTKILYNLHTTKEFGDFYLTADEKRKTFSRFVKLEHWKVAYSIFEGRGRDVFRYHKKELEKMDIKLNWFWISKYLLAMIVKVRPIINWIQNQMNKSTESKKKKEAIQAIIQNKQNNIVLSEDENDVKENEYNMKLAD
jgi:glycosyltransferase involved in cell wall biosynthesis